MNSATLPAPVIAARDSAIQSVAQSAGEQFRESARDFVLKYLRTHGETSGEKLTDEAIGWGIKPLNDDMRSFGPVYGSLKREGFIERVGYCPRLKGHGTAGGSIWRIKEPITDFFPA